MGGYIVGNTGDESNGDGGGTRRWRWRLVVAAVGVVALAGIGAGVALQPGTANALGYALAVRNGLPNHFTYQGMPYSNVYLCAGSAACQPSHAQHWSQDDLDHAGIWPLKQVGSIFTLFGPAHPVLQPVNDPSMTGAGGPYASDVRPFVLFVPDDAGSYFVYVRPGGP